MIIFKTLEDLGKIKTSDPAYPVIKDCLLKSIDLEGYLILVERKDLGRPLSLPELKGQWSEMNWEGVVRKDGYFHAIYLTNNEFALEFLIPDEQWLNDDVREKLEDART